MPALWLDCDTGHDDAFAILLAAHHPALRLLGISTVFGNALLEKTTYNTRAILKAIAREDVPVYAGASKPVLRAALHAPTDIHGESGLDGTTDLPVPTVPVRDDVDAVEAMYRALSSEPPGTAWLVATGCLTNIAQLFARYPALTSQIAGLSIMGGAIGGGFTDAPLGKVATDQYERFGNWTPFAEFNTYCDPEAADAIFSNLPLAAKTTLIPLDLTHKFLATKDMQYGVLFGFGFMTEIEPTMDGVSPLRRLFFEILTFFSKTYADVFGLTDGPPTHDPLAVAIIFTPESFISNADVSRDGSQDERFSIRVVTTGPHSSDSHPSSSADGHSNQQVSECGRTVATLLPAGSTGIRIPRGLEAKELWGVIESCLWRADVAVERSRPEKNPMQKGKVDNREIENLEDFQGNIQALMSTIAKKSREGGAEHLPISGGAAH